MVSVSNHASLCTCVHIPLLIQTHRSLVPLTYQRYMLSPTTPSNPGAVLLARRPPHAELRLMFFHELSQCLFDFVIQLLPTAEEMAIKEDVRRLLEKLIRTIEPESRLLSFGSTANGFSLRNSGA